MPTLRKNTIYFHPTENAIKQWLTELTDYSPQQIDTVMAKIVQGSPPVASKRTGTARKA